MTDSSLLIRAATLDDLALVQQIGYETYKEHFAALWSSEGLEAFLDEDFSEVPLSKTLAAPDLHRWLLAFGADNAPIGFAKVNWSRAEPISGKPGAELQKLYFRAASAGKGLGEALLQIIINEAQLRGETSLWLDVLRSNSRAQRFYERMGFCKVGDISFNTDIQAIGMSVMVRPLASASLR